MNDPEASVFESTDGSFAAHVCAYDGKVVVAVHSKGDSGATIVAELTLEEFMTFAHQLGRTANIISRRVME